MFLLRKKINVLTLNFPITLNDVDIREDYKLYFQDADIQLMKKLIRLLKYARNNGCIKILYFLLPFQ